MYTYNLQRIMASTLSKHTEHQMAGEKTGAITAGEMPKDTKDCLAEKALNRLVAMAQNKPKLITTLQNALVPCTVVAPYMNPLDALAAANDACSAVSVDVPHAKRRVFTVLETVQKASKEWLGLKRKEGRKYDLAPRQSEIEKEIVEGAMEWLKSSPEGTEDSLVTELIRRCEKEADCSRSVLQKFQKAGYVQFDERGRLTYNLPQVKVTTGTSSQARGAQARVLRQLHGSSLSIRPETEAQFLAFVQPVCRVWFTVPPARFFGMNMKQIRHRNIGENKNVKTGKSDSKNEPQNSKQSETKSKSQMETEFAIGVYTGENNVREHISVTPGGVTGVEVSVIGQADPSKRLKKSSAKRLDSAYRMRAVGQTKGLSEFFTQRLTVAVRGTNAVLMPADDEEKKSIILKVTGWLSSIQSCSSTTVPKLQQELANMCVGKVRRLPPSTISDLLQSSGYISIGGDGKVVYHLPTDRGDSESKTTTATWQQKTVEMSVKSCNLASRLRQAFPRRKTRKGVPVKKPQNVPTQLSCAVAVLPDDDDTVQDYDDYDFDAYDPYDAYEDVVGNFDDDLDSYDPYDYGYDEY